jgi:hypothetical protein
MSFEEFKAKMIERTAPAGFVFDDTCALICYFTASCRNDPQAHSSYCKIANTPSTCFGLYYKFALFPFCFQPNDPSCPVCNPISCLLIIFLSNNSRFIAVGTAPLRPALSWQIRKRLLMHLFEGYTFWLPLLNFNEVSLHS